MSQRDPAGDYRSSADASAGSTGGTRLLPFPRTRRLNRHVSRARSRRRAVVGAACWGRVSVEPASSLRRPVRWLPRNRSSDFVRRGSRCCTTPLAAARRRRRARPLQRQSGRLKRSGTDSRFPPGASSSSAVATRSSPIACRQAANTRCALVARRVSCRFVVASLLTRYRGCGWRCVRCGGASARTRRRTLGAASAPLLSLSGAKTCLCPLAGSFELAHTCQARRPLSVGLGFVQVVTLTRVLSLCSQIVQMPCGHEVRPLWRGGRAPAAVTGQRRASRRPLSVSGGV